MQKDSVIAPGAGQYQMHSPMYQRKIPANIKSAEIFNEWTGACSEAVPAGIHTATVFPLWQSVFP